jgi:hypothetical protein
METISMAEPTMLINVSSGSTFHADRSKCPAAVPQSPVRPVDGAGVRQMRARSGERT